MKIVELEKQWRGKESLLNYGTFDELGISEWTLWVSETILLVS